VPAINVLAIYGIACDMLGSANRRTTMLLAFAVIVSLVVGFFIGAATVLIVQSRDPPDLMERSPQVDRR
jgi:hypothetical protein